ncbi:radical SAM protein [Clostridium estertheticum]|uniref:Radical SAM protein n=1 Tax=Clostridium estertheticum TaxID=238834 RepID=A0A7Y3T055_9CLOT|nr:radical SAM protein [Clostridium estertheticum]NNU78605.1 radical SAM protein [Clostridium estertheticum]WBL49658.1 radical SAM protein [Clostridium estertheticum]
MKDNNLYYEKFKSLSGNSYIYDGVTSVVIPDDGMLDQVIQLKDKELSDSDVIEILKDTFQAEQLKSTLMFYNRWERNYDGFHIDKREDKVPIVDAQSMKEALDYGNIYILILNVTEDCNLRCKYCYLSEAYDYTRNRTSKRMTFDIAKKALDYYFRLIEEYRYRKPNKKANINFFGGEPLIEFDLMKKVVDYAKKHAPTEVNFNITTNGYLLNDSISDFLVENNFYISVSLDGSKENNNKRVLENNVETFDRVVYNLKRFKERYPDYNDIGILSVYDIKTNLLANVEFFDENKLPTVLRATGTSNNNTDYYYQFTKEDYDHFHTVINKLRNEYMEKKCNNEKMSPYLQVFFEMEIFQVLMRKRHKDDNSGTIIPYTGTCIPGIRLSVRADGTFDICERMNQHFPIGNVDTGYDYEALADIVNKYNSSVITNCKGCIASKICQLCFAQTAGENEFQNKPDVCKQLRSMIKSGNSIIYSILEQNADAYTIEGMEKVIENMIKFEG